MTVRTFVVNVTTAADGSATAYTPKLSGILCAIQYIKTDFTDGVDFAITAEATGETLWTESNVNSAKVCRPRGQTHSSAGVAALYAAGDQPVNDLIRLGCDRVKIVVGSGGSARTGAFHVIVDDLLPTRAEALAHTTPQGGGGGGGEEIPDNVLTFGGDPLTFGGEYLTFGA